LKGTESCWFKINIISRKIKLKLSSKTNFENIKQNTKKYYRKLLVKDSQVKCLRHKFKQVFKIKEIKIKTKKCSLYVKNFRQIKL